MTEKVSNGLSRKLGMGHVLGIIVGTVIGSGVFVTLPIVAQAAGSPGMAILAWLIGGVVWIPQILILAEMATAYPEEGFGYLYLRKAGSRPLAFLYVWTVFWTSDTPSITIITLSAASALQVFWPPLDGTIYGKLFAVALISALTVLHYLDVRKGGNLQVLLTVIKLSPLLLLVVLGLSHLDWGNMFFTPSAEAAEKPVSGLLLAAVAATVWSYAGFPNILYMAGEVKQPHRTLPQALIGSVLGVMLAYVLIAVATSAIVPYHDLTGFVGSFANPFLYLPAFAKIAATFLAIAAFISMIGAANACIMVQPRIEYAIARDGLFFTAFGHVHPRFQTPDYSILLQSGLAIVLVFIGNIENYLGYFTLSYLVQNAIVYAAIFKLRRNSDYQPTYRAPAWWLMASLAVTSQVLLAYGTFEAFPTTGVLAAAGLILTGLPVYFYFAKSYRDKSV